MRWTTRKLRKVGIRITTRKRTPRMTLNWAPMRRLKRRIEGDPGDVEYNSDS